MQAMAATSGTPEDRSENRSRGDLELEGMESSNLPDGQGTSDAYHYASVPSHVRHAQRLFFDNERDARRI